MLKPDVAPSSKNVTRSLRATCFIVPASLVTKRSPVARVVADADVVPSQAAFISVAVAVTPSKIFNSAAVEVTPSKIFNSEAVAVTPSRIFNSAVVTVAPSNICISASVSAASAADPPD